MLTNPVFLWEPIMEPPPRTFFAYPAGTAQKAVVFLLPPLLVLVLEICFWQGMRASDDLDYAHLAQSLLQPGQAVMSVRSHHLARLGMTVPLAFVFSVFGVSSWSLTLLPLVYTVLTSALVATLANRLFGVCAAIISGCLYAFFPLTIHLATFYVPEPLVILELTLASLLFLSMLENPGKRAPCLGFVSGVLVGLAYLTTEAGALMIIVFGAYLGVRRLARPRHFWVLAGFAVVVGLELAYHAAAHGDPFYRLTLSEQYMMRDAMVRSANLDLADRIFKAYPRFFVYPNIDFGVFGPLLLIGGAYGLIQRSRCALLVVWAAVFFGFYNFMSVSVTQYVALPVAPRLLAPGCAPLLILAGKVGADLCGVGRSARPAVRALVRASLVAVGGALAVVSLVCAYLASDTSMRAVLARNAEAAAEYLHDVPSILLVSDARSAKAVQFLREFNPHDSFVGFGGTPHLSNVDPAFGPDREAFVLLNGPALHEKDIAGFAYGGQTSMSSNTNRSQFPPPENVEVFTSRPEKGPLFHALLGYGWVQRVLGQYGYRVAKNLFMADPRFREVHVFRYQPVSQLRDHRRDVPIRRVSAESVRDPVWNSYGGGKKR